MKKTLLIFFFLFATFVLFACQEEENFPKANLGECSYHPSFLWSDADTCGVTRKLYLDFNADAKGDKECFAEIAFVDKDGNPIPDDILEIAIDGIIAEGNSFKAYSTDTVKEVKFRFLPKAESGYHQGYLHLVSYKLDRFEDQELDGTSVEVMRWALSYDKSMNPLAKVLMWICVLILTLLLVWLLILKPAFYPRFKNINKIFNIPGQAPLIVRTRGVRMVVISNIPRNDSFWNALIKGPVLYKTHPAFHTPITLLPRKNGILVKTDFTKYKVSVNPIPRIGTCEITEITNNLKITVQ